MMKKKMLLAAVALCLGMASATSFAAEVKDAVQKEDLVLTNEWDKVFPKSDEVNHRKVTFVNHFGITLAADLYEPKNHKGKLPAIAVSGPYGAVKEQVSGRYAQELAKRGFLTIAFDPSFYGESGGSPRNMNSPDINMEDFQAAIDFLSVQENVNPEQIGILGICGWGGFAVHTASLDTRIKATATITMYDMSRVMAYNYNDTGDETYRYNLRKTISDQRTQDYKTGKYAISPSLPDEVKEDMPQFLKDYIEFYKKPRGYHPRSIGSTGGFATSTLGSLLNMHLMEYADEIRTPVLLVHGENAHSRYFSETVIKKLKSGSYGENKELLIIKGANHTDLYDQTDKIPFDKLEKFFKDNLVH